jgi:hypothetical protein
VAKPKGKRVVYSIGDAWKRFSRRKGGQIGRKLRSGRRAGHAVELNRAEARVLFDRIALRELNMSGDEFLRRLDAGDLPDNPVVEHLALMAGGARTGV